MRRVTNIVARIFPEREEDKRVKKGKREGERREVKKPARRAGCRGGVYLADRVTSSDCPGLTGYHPAESRLW